MKWPSAQTLTGSPARTLASVLDRRTGMVVCVCEREREKRKEPVSLKNMLSGVLRQSSGVCLLSVRVGAWVPLASTRLMLRYAMERIRGLLNQVMRARVLLWWEALRVWELYTLARSTHTFYLLLHHQPHIAHTHRALRCAAQSNSKPDPI
jgi:hypothetical protein